MTLRALAPRRTMGCGVREKRDAKYGFGTHWTGAPKMMTGKAKAEAGLSYHKD